MSPMLPMTTVEWRVGPAANLAAPHGLKEVRIVTATQRDGSWLYAVREGRWCANESREWELEPIPSDRDEAFTARCRWDNWHDAAYVAQHMAKEMLREGQDQ